MCTNLTTSINPEFQHFTKNREIVFFLGAGFSADLGLPIMKDFRAASELEYKLLSKENSRIKPTVEMFLRSYQFYDDLRNLIKGAERYIGINPDNFEDIFCVAESFLNCGILAQTLNSGKWHMGGVYQHIGFWLWNMYKQCPPLDDRKGKKNEELVYEDFFCFLEKEIRDRMAIVTTNYDLTCEYYMNKNRFQVSYPIPKTKFEDVCICKKQNYYVESETAFKIVPLCKLHGSVNYFENDDHFFINRELAEKGEYIGGSSITEKRPALFALDALSEIRKKLKPLKNFEIGVIPPTYSKLDKKDWLKYTWNGAFELIKKAKAIVFIGYSFPDSDGFMKAMFQAALSLRAEDDDLSVIVVDKNKAVLEKFKNDYFINNKSVEILEGRFTEIWENGGLKEILRNL